MPEKEPKEKVYNVKYTRTELEQRIRKLQESENMNMALKVMDGQGEFDELNKLAEILEKDSEKDEKKEE